MLTLAVTQTAQMGLTAGRGLTATHAAVLADLMIIEVN